MNNKEAMDGVEYTGVLDFENYWGERLLYVEVTHHVDSIFNEHPRLSQSMNFQGVDDKTKLSNVMYFKYKLGDMNGLDFWTVHIMTESGINYTTKKLLRCSIRDEDHGRVILGVNGESKSMYVSMASGTCSVPLITY
ncbi:hypothetical protein [Providencia manganoxydans]|uniref:hypothetical protein n=1 Tax=Providencia manganoxydans TaxID=2923283 RepID=UPI0028103B11|nr:hypothetical protein [Providencia stuartii]ELR5080893.1 hypothetical protein [Providencia stuartii]